MTYHPGTLNAQGLASPRTIRKAFSAGGGGSPDDVTIYNANAPLGFRILDAFVFVSTAVAASSVTLRTASGGGGSAVSDSFSSAATGSVRLSTTSSTNTIAQDGSLFLRRSDSGVAGEVILLVAPT